MGTWYLSLAFSLFLILVGIYIHWSVVLAGMLLPFVPMISILLDRRRRRVSGEGSDSDASQAVRSSDRCEGSTSGE
jgi:hypothetical protein